MANPDYPPQPILEVLEKLKNLPGAKVERRGNALIIIVEEQEKWKEAIAVLKLIFGETIFKEYERKLGEFSPDDPEHQKRLQYQCEVSFAGLDEMFVLLDNEEPAGFLAVEDYQGSGIVRDVVMKGAYRGKGRAAELYGLLFQQGKYNSILGYSKSPRAISARQTAGDENGYRSYYGNQLGGRTGEEMTLQQQKVVNYLREQGLLATNSGVKMPAGYVLLKGDLEILPATEVDVPTARMSALARPLGRLNELQRAVFAENREKNLGKPKGERELPDSVAGILVSIKSI